MFVKYSLYAIAPFPTAFCLNSYLRSLPRVPTLLRDHVGTPETIFLYQMPLESLFVPQRLFSCTYRAYDRGLSPVPNAALVAFRTSEAFLVYQLRLCSPLVPRRPFPCTKHRTCSSSYSRGPSAVPIVVPLLIVSVCRSYTRVPCPVPRAFCSAVCTPEPFALHRMRF